MEAVEEKAKMADEISEAAAVAYSGNNIALYVCSNLTINEKFVMESVMKNARFSVFEVPDIIVVKNQLPRMNNGKVNYQALEKEAENWNVKSFEPNEIY